MIIAIIYTIIIYISYWLLLRKYVEHIKNPLIKISLVFFLSNYLSIFIIFGLACFFSLFTSHLLQKATLIYSLSLAIFLTFNNRELIMLGPLVKRKIAGIHYGKLLFIIFLFAVSFIFFENQLQLKHNQIFTSFIFWDFHWHVGSINNFAYGDNFPPQNEAISGLVNVYHYFFDLIPAVYETLGANLADAINLASGLSLGFLLLTVIGLMNEYAKNSVSFFLLPLAVLSHGSLQFIQTALQIASGRIEPAQVLLTNRPDLIDFNFDSDGGIFFYNGNMFNIFYFLQERQLLFGCFALLIFVYILLNTEKFNKKFLIFLGVLFGLFLQWQLFITIVFVVSGISYFLLSFLFKTKQKHLLYFILPLVCTFMFYAGGISLYTHLNENFDHVLLKKFPRLNFGFTATALYPLSLLHFVLFYLYAYGFRLLVYISAFLLTYKKNQRIFLLLLGFLPVFIIINTIQLTPMNIYVNYKLLKAFNLVFDTFSFMFFVYWITTSQISAFIKTCLFILVFFSCFSGTLSFIAYYLQSPTNFYADYKDSFYLAIKNTPPHAVFLTDYPKYVFLAGRKTYVASYLGSDLGINTKMRENIKDMVVTLPTTEELCRYIKLHYLQHSFQYVYIQKQYILLDVNKNCR